MLPCGEEMVIGGGDPTPGKTKYRPQRPLLSTVTLVEPAGPLIVTVVPGSPVPKKALKTGAEQFGERQCAVNSAGVEGGVGGGGLSGGPGGGGGGPGGPLTIVVVVVVVVDATVVVVVVAGGVVATVGGGSALIGCGATSAALGAADVRGGPVRADVAGSR